MTIVSACLQGAVIEGANLAPTEEDDMSSIPAATPLDNADLALVREALRNAGLRGIDSYASSDMKRDAVLFLTAAFRGARTKTALSELLSAAMSNTGKPLIGSRIRAAVNCPALSEPVSSIHRRDIC
jgi:hypothetical protein